MIIYHNNTSVEVSKSIIVAGVRASGKSSLIDSLSRMIKAPLIHRPIIEEKGEAGSGSIIHWPIAEKFPTGMNLKNVGVVIMLTKEWTVYCRNVEERKHLTQYTRLGLNEVNNQWIAYFNSHNLPIITVTRNDCSLQPLIHSIMTVLSAN